MASETFERRAKWAEKFLATYADGNRQKLLGVYDFHAVVRHLAGAVQQIAGETPECPYCGATEGLRYLHRGYGSVAPEFICETDFTPSDDGPCFDDLPRVLASDLSETLDRYSKQLGWGLGGHQEECLTLLDMAVDELVSAREQINRLANFIMAEVPGEPSESEGAIDTAIRWMRAAIAKATP